MWMGSDEAAMKDLTKAITNFTDLVEAVNSKAAEENVREGYGKGSSMARAIAGKPQVSATHKGRGVKKLLVICKRCGTAYVACPCPLYMV